MLVILLLLCSTVAVLLLATRGANSALLTLLSGRCWRRVRSLPEIGDRWPVVAVQLPIYNERYVAERLIAAMVALDYPHDRPEVQVLDDSTDETVAVVQRAVARAHGLHIHHLRRKDRSGWKAAALAAGLDTTPGELVAIFDADAVPPLDFLRRTVPCLIADAHLGCAQARWSHLDGNYSLLTRAQQTHDDAKCVVDQLGRNRSGGAWRREAIVAAGGWQADTLRQDLGLSYRPQLAGWRSLVLPEVTVPSELPPQLEALRQQQCCRAKGTSQVTRKLLPSLWRAALPLRVKIVGTFHLLNYVVYLLLLVLVLIQLSLILTGAAPAPAALLAGLATLGPLLMYGSAEVRLRGWQAALCHLPLRLVLWTGLSVIITRGVFAGLLDRPGYWQRTPTFGVCTANVSSRSSPYAFRLERVVWAEAFVALYALMSCGIAATAGQYAVAVWLGCFSASCVLVATVTLWQAYTILRVAAIRRCYSWHQRCRGRLVAGDHISRPAPHRSAFIVGVAVNTTPAARITGSELSHLIPTTKGGSYVGIWHGFVQFEATTG